MSAPTPSSDRLHATCVVVAGTGVLLSGRSGAGKSDLALRLIDRGARLVADDTILVQRRDERLIASAVDAADGRMEVRGLGLLLFDTEAEIAVGLLVDLSEGGERMPMADERRRVAGVDLPVLRLDPAPASAPIKVELAVARLAAR